MSICLSTIASVSGPSKVILTLSALAACSAPSFTACQNWCWKPLEIERDVGFVGARAGREPDRHQGAERDADMPFVQHVHFLRFRSSFCNRCALRLFSAGGLRSIF